VYDVISATRLALDAQGPQTADAARQLPPLVQFGDDMRHRSTVLKKFLFQNLYRHPQVVHTTGQARQVVRVLFAAYTHAPQEMQAGFSARSDATRGEHDAAHSAARVVADYIAGMTDRFASREHERLTGCKILVP
jgi:dGTPase